MAPRSAGGSRQIWLQIGYFYANTGVGHVAQNAERRSFKDFHGWHERCSLRDSRLGSEANTKDKAAKVHIYQNSRLACTTQMTRGFSLTSFLASCGSSAAASYDHDRFRADRRQD